MLKRACAGVLTLTAAACAGSSPTSPSSPPASSQAGIRYDNIQTVHELIVGSPIPTQNQSSTYCCWPLPVRNAGSYIFNLSGFPLNVLPSGGTSNVISESEMVLVGLNASPATGAMTFQWHKAVNQDTVVYTFTGSASASWAYAYIGRFSWEMSEPGSYYVVVDTPWGSARLDFVVTNSSLTGLRPGSDAVRLASRKPPNVHARVLLEQGGGGGSGP